MYDTIKTTEVRAISGELTKFCLIRDALTDKSQVWAVTIDSKVWSEHLSEESGMKTFDATVNSFIDLKMRS